MHDNELKRGNGHSVVDWILLILLLTLIFEAPWPYGAVTESGLTRLEILAYTTAALAILLRPRSLRTAFIPVCCAALIAVVGVIQVLPVTSPTLDSLSPAVSSIYHDTNSILALFSRPPAQPRLSIAPTDTVRASLAVMAYVACFISGALILGTTLQRRIATIALILAAIVQVAFGTAENAGRMHGTFVNPNHLAGYLEIGLTAAFALIWTAIVMRRRRTHRRENAAKSIERRFLPIALRALGWIVIAAGIALSGSRMGMVATGITTIALVFASAAHRRASRRNATTAAVTLLLVALVIVGAITREVPVARFLVSDPRDPQSDFRFRLWRLSLKVSQQSPLFGFGLGSFREAFKRVQPTDLPGLFEQAHNDSLQLLVTGGWIALLLGAAAVISILAILIHGWWIQRHREESAIALASAAALISLLIHGIAEFNFSIPAIPATLCIFLGTGWAATRRDRDLEPAHQTRPDTVEGSVVKGALQVDPLNPRAEDP